jgi:hypothetical protein
MNPEFECFEDDFLTQEQIDDGPEEYGYEFVDGDEYEHEDDGPDEYTEWQDYMGGDDWDHGQYDDPF